MLLHIVACTYRRRLWPWYQNICFPRLIATTWSPWYHRGISRFLPGLERHCHTGGPLRCSTRRCAGGAMASNGAAETLVVTLRRGIAGRKAYELSALSALGLKRRNQVKHLRNDPSNRGQVHKISHLLRVDLSSHMHQRLDTLHRQHNRPHCVVQH